MKKLLATAALSIGLTTMPIVHEVAQSEMVVHVGIAPTYHHWYANVERWHATAISAGWSEWQWYRLSQIIYRESRGNPYAFNRYDCCGGSIGLTQINGVHWNWMMRAGLIAYPWQLTNAWRNLRAAKALYNRAGGWGPWY